jgi:hypothetical protein
MSPARSTRLAAWLVLLLAPGATARADSTDRLGGSSWSPDGRWLAFNWPERPELFVISPKSGASFMLRPAGEIQLEGGQVFSAQAQSGQADLRRTTRLVASPGRDKLTFLEWSPDSASVAYQAWAGTNALFSVLEGTVSRRMAASDVLPWRKADELRVIFELINAGPDRPTRYSMRVEKLNGAIVKQIAFEDAREIRCIAAVRYHDTSFLSANRQFILYPRVTTNGWQILRESLAGGASAPQPITKPDPHEPYQWQLSSDDRFLALVQGDTLTIGALDDWGRTKTISLPHDSVTVRWSPDGRFLAFLDGRALYVLAPILDLESDSRRGSGPARDGDQPKLVTENCSQRFWGWRGSRLYFGDPRTDLTNLSCVDADHLGPPAQVTTRSTRWGSATREVKLSPDGTQLVCLVVEIDYMGRALWQLWQTAVQTNAEWQLLYELKPQ